jgi:hypothetical protein
MPRGTPASCKTLKSFVCALSRARLGRSVFLIDKDLHGCRQAFMELALRQSSVNSIDAGKIADCLRCDFLPECPHGFDSDSGSTAYAALPTFVGAAQDLVAANSLVRIPLSAFARSCRGLDAVTAGYFPAPLRWPRAVRGNSPPYAIAFCCGLLPFP